LFVFVFVSLCVYACVVFVRVKGTLLYTFQPNLDKSITSITSSCMDRMLILKTVKVTHQYTLLLYLETALLLNMPNNRSYRSTQKLYCNVSNESVAARCILTQVDSGKTLKPIGHHINECNFG